MLTFSPRWDQDTKPLERFTNIGQLQADLKAYGLPLESEVERAGPGSFMLVDPDGHPILVDQHVEAP